LNTLILPNGYTVNLNAAPRSADSGGKETMDSEGKVTGPGGKGKDAGTIAQTSGGGRRDRSHRQPDRQGRRDWGAVSGRRPGSLPVLLSRGPEAELPRGSTMDIVLERELSLDASQIQFTNLGQAPGVVQPPMRPPD